MKVFSKIILSELMLVFFEDEGQISFTLAPSNADIDISEHKGNLPLTQLRLVGDDFFRNYSAGLSMAKSSTSRKMRLVKQADLPDRTETTFMSGSIEYTHIIEKGKALKVYNKVKNIGKTDAIIEYLPSAVLSGFPITGAADGNVKVHRLRSCWSSEAQVETCTLAQLNFENSWANGWGGRYIKWGQRGSMPNREFMPLTVLEDTKSGFSLAVYHEAPSSWQHELSRFGEKLSLSVGDGDFDFAHNRFKLESGKSYKTRAAYISADTGDMDNVCHHIIEKLDKESDSNLGVIYNEYCASWGNPTLSNIKQQVEYAKNLGAEYFVIDAGWYRNSDNWATELGDWNVGEAFDGEITDAVAAIKSAGLKAGLWFEPEIVCEKSTFYNDNQLFLTRDGYPIINENRKFLDFRKESVLKHLQKAVTEKIKEWGFDYIKADYNDPIGIGADGDVSLGASLKSHINGVIDFYKNLKQQTGIELEICSSGGHRIEPQFIKIADTVSFSDAHEGHEGAIIAADMSRLCPQAKSQIWAVINPNLTESEIRYRLMTALMGRMCLSGKLSQLNESQYNLVKEATEFYKQAALLIKNGKFSIKRTTLSRQNPTGHQVYTKTQNDYKLIIFHSFNEKTDLFLNLSRTETVKNKFGEITDKNGEVTVKLNAFDAAAVLIHNSN